MLFIKYNSNFRNNLWCKVPILTLYRHCQLVKEWVLSLSVMVSTFLICFCHISCYTTYYIKNVENDTISYAHAVTLKYKSVTKKTKIPSVAYFRVLNTKLNYILYIYFYIYIHKGDMVRTDF